MFNKILIANRGEIACRVIETARQFGIQTVAVYSAADANALHVEQADEAYCIGPAPAQQSYLNIDAIINIALKSGAEAIHPGYGFLSENPQFCRACEENSIVFIGPPTAAIEAMGSKAQAKLIMKKAKVPLVPGYQGQDQSSQVLLSEAATIGFPVLIKASAGGGGKGMRLVEKEKDFASALKSAKREAQQSFGDERVILEKYLRHARHVEVQVFCDQYGNGVYLGDRDCSMQRRHQKILEEAPAPDLLPGLRKTMGEAAVRAALAIDYRGAGTVEFLLDGNGQFYFMEMNTRLQVEHPVTEMISGVDLVEWQLRIAAGEKLPLEQEGIQLKGHAIEARIYAEDCEQGFIPSSGIINYLHWPPTNTGVRIDTGVRQGDEVSSHYDPMLAKLIVWGGDRRQALRQLESALRDCRLAGVQTNLPFLSRLQTSEAFQSANFHTAYVDNHIEELLRDDGDKLWSLALAGVAFWLGHNNPKAQDSPWNLNDAWRMNLPRHQFFKFTDRGELRTVKITAGQNFVVQVEATQVCLEAELEHDQLITVRDGHRERYAVCFDNNENVTVFIDNRAYVFSLWAQTSAGMQTSDTATSICAPMHGRLIDLSVTAGQSVAAGDPIGIVEAMKMEHTLRASIAGTVVRVYYVINDIVDNGAVVVELEQA